jgi:hypothetical protein
VWNNVATCHYVADFISLTKNLFQFLSKSIQGSALQIGGGRGMTGSHELPVWEGRFLLSNL